jgi:signal transduction histidine kinase/Flp pilus assembly protein TadD
VFKFRFSYCFFIIIIFVSSITITFSQTYNVEEKNIAADKIAQFKSYLGSKDTLKAINHILFFVDSLANHDNQLERFNTYDTLAFLLSKISEYERAISLYEQTADFFISQKQYDKAADIYWEISLNYARLYKYSEANQYSKKIIALKNKLNDSKIISSAYNDLGLIFWKLGELDSAVTYINKSLTIAKNRDDSISLAKRYNNLGVIYWRKGDIENAYKYYSESLVIREAIDDKQSVTKVLNNLALVFQRLNYFDLAESYINRALKISREINDPIGISYSLRRLGNLYLIMNDLDQAEKLLLESIDILFEIDDQISLVQVYNLLGNIYEKKDDEEEAIKNYTKAEELAIIINDKFSQALAHYNLGSISLKQNLERESYFHLEKSLDLSEKFGYRIIKRDTYKKFAEYFRSTKNISKENYFLYKFINVNDSLLNESIISSISEVNTRNLIKISEERRILLQKENELQKSKIEYQNFILTVFIILSIVVLGLLTYSLFLNKKMKRLVSLIELKNEELESANEAKDKLFSIIAHDLKGPFTSILGFSELIYEESENKNQKEIKEYSSHLIKNLNRLVELINNLLNWSLIQREKISINKEELNASELVEHVLNDLELNAKLKSISFNKSIEKDILIKGDRSMLSSAFRNIISNAVKYSPQNSSIKINCTKKSNYMHFEVKDSGKGMPKEKINTILNGDLTESTLGTNNEKGTGIGISICKDFVEQHEGKLEIESDNNSFTLFRIILPIN